MPRPRNLLPRHYGWGKSSALDRAIQSRALTHQVWNTTTESFCSKNKYRGREVKTLDFHRVLGHFLHDGDRLLVAHIPSIIQKLHNLAEIMLDLDGFRFYGCSLLLIYDGDKEAQDHFARHANPHPRGDIGGAKLERVDEGEDEWVDIRHRPSRITPIPNDGDPSESPSAATTTRRSKSVEYDPVQHRHRRRAGSGASSSHLVPHTHDHPDAHGRRQPDAANTKRLRGEVNIRVVDFAHTTTGRDFLPFPPDHVDPPEKQLGKGYDTQVDPETGLNLARFPPKHLGRPDMGFVFGLKNVCAALEAIWREEAGDEVVDEWLEGMENGHVFRKAFGESQGEGESDAEAELST